MLLVGKADAARPMLLIYPRLKARRLFCELSRVIGMDSQLSDVPPGADHRDLLNSQNNRMKSIAVERLYLPTFFSCSKKVGWTMAAAALDSFEKWHGCQYAKHMLLAQHEETDPACCKHLKLVNHTSVMTGTQARLPCRAVQLGEAVPLKNPAEPY
jgi:hypothetical protein